MASQSSLLPLFVSIESFMSLYVHTYNKHQNLDLKPNSTQKLAHDVTIALDHIGIGRISKNYTCPDRILKEKKGSV